MTDAEWILTAAVVHISNSDLREPKQAKHYEAAPESDHTAPDTFMGWMRLIGGALWVIFCTGLSVIGTLVALWFAAPYIWKAMLATSRYLFL